MEHIIGIARNLYWRGHPHSSWGGTPDLLNDRCKPTEQGSGQKNEEILRNYFVKMYFGISWGRLLPPHPSALPDCQGVGVIASPKMPRAWLRL